MKVIWHFSEIHKENVKEVGGKGANLGEMFNAGFPVPPGFVVSSEAYFYFIEKTGVKNIIIETLKDLDVNDFEKLRQASEKIQQAIIQQNVPEEIKGEIINNYRNLGGRVAVRSSATAEDLPEASFAGQQATYLNVEGEENVVEAVKKCWASLFTARAIFYRQQNNFDHLKVGIAVVVQKMVNSEVSGVAFTKHPTGENDHVIIEAVWGLGEGIVSGRYTPDHYEVDPNTLKIVVKNVVSQDKMLKYENGENREVEVPENLKNAPKLDDSKIIELAKLCLRIEDHYKKPQDIEWALENNQLYIVQSRPITTIKKKEELKVLTKGLAASPGIGVGRVKIVFNLDELGKVQSGDILVTKMTNPDMVPAMKKASAIVTDEGGMTSHAAIVSRELGIPCVVGTGNATQVLKEGQIVTVDGSRGIVYEGDVSQVLGGKKEKKEEMVETVSYIPTATKIYVNISEPEAAERVAKKQVDGVGLLRAEFILASIGMHPKKALKEGKREEFVNKLAEGIGKIARAFYPRPVVYRCFDLKSNEYRDLPGGEEFELPENNPMIGYRGASRYIKDKDVFEMELDAIKKVREEWGLKNLWVMIPFVRTIYEIKTIRKIFEEKGFLNDRDFKLWMMVEVPSTVILIEEFLKYVDGVSIGSNDLTQLILGIDRDNPLLAWEFDERNPAVLEAIKRVIMACRKMRKTVSICGQAPSTHPDIVEYLVRWGITSISVNPDMVDYVRRMVAGIERKILLEELRNE